MLLPGTKDLLPVPINDAAAGTRAGGGGDADAGQTGQDLDNIICTGMTRFLKSRGMTTFFHRLFYILYRNLIT